ncbi:MAG: helix-turn-helix domain-containing protein [Clostridia bacterium]|nr:helix-turn-helix domain-containing protein [Clostridia bacterium]
MFTYFPHGQGSSEVYSDRYLAINSFRSYEDLKHCDIRRPRGRVDYQLIYVRSGLLTVFDGKEEMAVGAGRICLFRPHEPQFYRLGESPLSFSFIHFTGTEAARLVAFFTERVYTVGDFYEFERYCDRSREHFRADDTYRQLLYEGELIALCARLSERVTVDEDLARAHDRMAPVLRLMRSECEVRRQNRELALLTGLSEQQFLKLFKSVTGTTPQRYYADLLIERSRHLLSTTDHTVGEVAALCGMEDTLYFSRFFKKHTGLSPREYRKRTAE